MDELSRLVLSAISCALLVAAGCDSGERGAHGPLRSKRQWPPHGDPRPYSSLAPTPMASPTLTPPPTLPGPCHEIYDQALLPTFSLEIDPDELDEIERERPLQIEDYHPAKFTYEGETHDVMVRNRGEGSDSAEKLQLAIAFNKVDPDARFRGLRRINLDHGNYQPLRERLALDFLRERVGLQVACANNARLEINGSYYGVYTNIEHASREFLSRNWAGPVGNLYKHPSGEKKNHDGDPDTSDYEALQDADDLDALDPIMDLEYAVRVWAALAILPARDSLWDGDRNYYVYNHPTEGWFYIPQDLDHGVPDTEDDDDPITPARHDPWRFVLEDPYWWDRFVSAAVEAQAHYKPEEFERRIDLWWAQVKDSAIEDPFLTRLKDPSDPDPFADLKKHFRRRAAYNQDWIDDNL